MPMNTFGFDCRAPRIMGDWMVGLPAERKYPGYPEDAIPGPDAKPGDGTYDSRPQPYQEIRPTIPATRWRWRPRRRVWPSITTAVATTTARTSSARTSSIRSIAAGRQGLPAGARSVRVRWRSRRAIPTRPTEYVQPPIGVPYHSHFFAYDPTDPPPPWSPRRPEWKSILVDRMVDPSPPAGTLDADDRG